MSERLGQQLGNYRLVQFIGRGGFADVYMGTHVYLATQAAIKVLQARLGPDDLQAFHNEARMIAHLKHPNIVRVLEFGEQQNVPYLVMDFASSGTLRSRHGKGTRLSLNQALSYVRPIASALQYAQDNKIVHRDIKPENMLVGQNGEILLSDFGIAVVSQSSRYAGQQQVGGTVAYMAPEQLHGKAVAASDQYALAIVIYEWLSGSVPFTGSFTEICSQHLFTPPPSLREKIPQISAEVEAVLFKALAKKSEERFPSVIAFVTALEAAAQGSPLAFPAAANSMGQSNQSTWIRNAAAGLGSKSDISTLQRPPAQPYGPPPLLPSGPQSTILPQEPYPSAAPSPTHYTGPVAGNIAPMYSQSLSNMPPQFTPPPAKPKTNKALLAIIGLLVGIIVIMATGGLYMLNAQKTGANSSTSNASAQTSHTTPTTINSSQSTSTTMATTPTLQSSTATATAAATIQTNALPNNPNNPKLPLSLQCVQPCYGEMDVTLKSITSDTSTGNYIWAFLITNKAGVSCSNDFFTQLYLALPDDTHNDPINHVDNWPMSVNQTVEEDAYFADLQPQVRYTLHVGLNYCYSNTYALNTYQTYDFYW